MKYYDKAISQFQKHYAKKLEETSIHYLDDDKDNQRIIYISSPDVKPGNEPRIYVQAHQTSQVIVLAHGLSDSPYYMTAIAEAFYAAGANVILPLMPAHGLKEPDKAMEDFKLESKWRDEIDVATEIASYLGSVISLGGFSSGGALCYNKILRDSDKIKGGLFLFAAAIDVKLISELGQLRFVSAIAKRTDGKIKGYGMDPYKYPKLPLFAALELGQVINQNEKLSEGHRISQPVFAAHAIDDVTAKLNAIQKLIKNHAERGVIYTLSNGMAHAELPLRDPIILDENYTDGKPAYANPDFDLMMESCISFYSKYITKSDIS